MGTCTVAGPLKNIAEINYIVGTINYTVITKPLQYRLMLHTTSIYIKNISTYIETRENVQMNPMQLLL